MLKIGGFNNLLFPKVWKKQKKRELLVKLLGVVLKIHHCFPSLEPKSKQANIFRTDLQNLRQVNYLRTRPVGDSAPIPIWAVILRPQRRMLLFAVRVDHESS